MASRIVISGAVALLVVAGAVGAILTRDSLRGGSTVTTTVTLTTVGTQSTITNSSGGCSRLAEAYAFYVHLVSDNSGVPISGARVQAIAHDACGVPIARLSLLTPRNGTVSLPTGNANDYAITVTYQGTSYLVQTNLNPLVVMNYTLSVPSGNLSITNQRPPS